jgi:hypothetical protein
MTPPTGTTETFDSVRDRIMAHIHSRGTDEVNGEPAEWIEDLDWRAYAAVLRVHTLEHLAQIRAILAAVPA